MDAFPLALAFTLPSEGGYCDVAGDHGGATNHGVTQSEYDSWRGRQNLPLAPVSQITRDEVREIYHDDYWHAMRCDLLAPRLGIATFDWGVNHGPMGACKMLQSVAGLSPDQQDGVIGPQTLSAISAYGVGLVLEKYLQARATWYLTFAHANPPEMRFLDGWENRVVALRKYLNQIPEVS